MNLKHPTEVQSAIYGFPNLSLRRQKTQVYNRPRFNTITSVEAVKDDGKNKMNRTLTENFMSRELMKKGENLDKFIEEHEDVKDVWK